MIDENSPYNADVMIGRPPQKEAPPFGQRLAAIRKEKGLTQKELAERLGVKREMVDYYERRAINPALEVVQSCAKVLKVPVSALVGDEQPLPAKAKSGPQSQLQRKFEQVKKLPRKQQEFVLQFLDTVIKNAEKA